MARAAANPLANLPRVRRSMDDTESIPALLAKLAQAYERLQSERDEFKAENGRLLRQLVVATEQDASTGREEGMLDGAPFPDHTVVVSVDSEVSRPWNVTLQECAVHAAPPPGPGASINVGDRVEVRDSEAEAWKAGTVVSLHPVKVKPDCWTVDSSATWEMIRPMGAAGPQSSPRPTTPAASAYGPGPVQSIPSVDYNSNSHSMASYNSNSRDYNKSIGNGGNGNGNGNGQPSQLPGGWGQSPARASSQLAMEHAQSEYVQQTGKVSAGHSAKAVKNYLRVELSQASACVQLPFAMILWVTFALSVFYHTKNETLHATDRAFVWDIEENANFAFVGEIPFENGRMGHKNVNDVNSFADFWSWFDFGLVPLFWAEGWDVREARSNMMARCMTTKDTMTAFGLGAAEVINMSSQDSYGRFNYAGNACPAGLSVQDPPTEIIGQNPLTPTYLWYNSVVGGMRMRQERTDTIDCISSDPNITASLHNGVCVENRVEGYWLKPELRAAYKTDESLVDRPGGETVYFLSGDTQTKVRRQIQALENKVWAGPMTGKIEMLYTSYNPHQDLLTATFIIFFVNHAGHIHKTVEPVSMWLHPYHNWIGCYVLDSLWILLVFKMVVEEAMDLAAHWKQLGVVKGTRCYLSISNVIDWFGIVFSVGIAVSWWSHLENLEVLKTYMRQGRVDVIGTWEDEAIRAGWFAEVKKATEEMYMLRVVLSVYPFVIVSRFFKACASQPRLSLVTKTLQMASVDIVHFGCVFGAVFIIYAESAMILFGQELEDFANTGRSLTAVFRILMGDFDWAGMIAIGRLEAGIWFGSFMVMVNLIMLNMLLAIIMDVYTEVRGSVGSNAKTLWRQAYDVVHRFLAQRRGELIPLADVLQVIDPTSFDKYDDDVDDESSPGIPDSQVFTPKTLCALIPGMSEAQALSILAESFALEDQDEGLSMSELSLKVQDIEEVLLEMNDTLKSHVTDFQSIHRGSRQAQYAGARGRRDQG